ncbi:MAG: UDP-glucose 4-epimerase GalE [Polyangiales bacterium]
MRVLVTGGAGYVGSGVIEELLAAGAQSVVALDDLSKGHAAAVVAKAKLIEGDIADRALVKRLCAEHRIDVVVHMAASSLVGESVQKPALYYQNNVVKGLALLEAIIECGVTRFIFSSTAAVYGDPQGSPISEDFALQPTNPYGETKLAFENALSWYGKAHGLRSTSLRYFNAAGATAHNGERHSPETHLIPIVLDVARGTRDHVSIFGDDYPTPDGTCIRDYIHVSDLARAHVLAIGGLETQSTRAFNLGCSGSGYSVRQVIDVAEKVTGRSIAIAKAPRRAGDPAVLVASSDRIQRELQWKPQREKLEVILQDAWRWLEAHPRGYE